MGQSQGGVAEGDLVAVAVTKGNGGLVDAAIHQEGAGAHDGDVGVRQLGVFKAGEGILWPRATEQQLDLAHQAIAELEGAGAVVVVGDEDFAARHAAHPREGNVRRRRPTSGRHAQLIGAGGVADGAALSDTTLSGRSLGQRWIGGR